jgi:putative Mn2+ efflux pump MntP
VVAKLVALILPLGLDTFAVAAAVGMLGPGGATRVRVSILFTVFEAGMPLVGLGLGVPLGHAIGSAAEYVAVGVLIAFGLYTLMEGGPDGEGQQRTVARLTEVRGPGAVLLGLSISMDELAIGFALGLLRVPVVLVILLIAAQALAVTQLGLRLGGRLSERLVEGAERVGGLALTVLGIVLLVEKLAA